MSAPAAAIDWADMLTRVIGGDDLDDATASAAMAAIMQGDVTPVRVAALLVALRSKGETAAEIAGLVASMRRFALSVDAPDHAVDTCGTGGDRAGTFNVSTVAALVAAGAGATVVKHGNRAASGRCGSADLLEDWGVVIDLPPAGVQACLDEVGIGFCFAPTFHPAMRHVMPARRELGVPTVFNFLGPLTNPAGVLRQTIGVSDPAMAPKMAEVLARLGARHALVFHGEDGLDELTTTGPSSVWEVRDGEVARWQLDPAHLGLAPAAATDLLGGDVADNRRIADAILDGAPGAPRDIVVLGAGAALYTTGAVSAIGEGMAAAADAIDEGRARGVRDRWVAASQRHARS